MYTPDYRRRLCLLFPCGWLMTLAPPTWRVAHRIYIYIYIYIYRERYTRLPKALMPAAQKLASSQGVAGCNDYRLPDGVRTNTFFAEVPQYTINVT